MSLVTPANRRLVERIEAMTKSRMKQGVIPSSKDVGMIKVSALLPKFTSQVKFARAIELLDAEWKKAIEEMSREEIIGRFLAILMPETLEEPQRNIFTGPADREGGRSQRREGGGGGGFRRDRGPDRGPRNFDRGSERGSDAGPARGPRNFDRRPDRGPDSRPDHAMDRGPRESHFAPRSFAKGPCDDVSHGPRRDAKPEFNKGKAPVKSARRS